MYKVRNKTLALFTKREEQSAAEQHAAKVEHLDLEPACRLYDDESEAPTLKDECELPF